jgi:hypothetical protein
MKKYIQLLLIIFILAIIIPVSVFDNPQEEGIQIEDSYQVWSPTQINSLVQQKTLVKYGTEDVKTALNRGHLSIYIEWWYHNIGYYITKSFCFIETINKINLRCKDVNLEQY